MFEVYQVYGDYVQMCYFMREMILFVVCNVIGGMVVCGCDCKGVEYEIDLVNEWYVIIVNEGILCGLGEEVIVDIFKEMFIGYVNKFGIVILLKWS